MISIAIGCQTYFISLDFVLLFFGVIGALSWYAPSLVV